MKPIVCTLSAVGGLIECDMSFREAVCPAKAGMFSGSQTHRGRSQRPIA
jgi:hypothetical protein